jgi:hypothetical protein
MDSLIQAEMSFTKAQQQGDIDRYYNLPTVSQEGDVL